MNVITYIKRGDCYEQEIYCSFTPYVYENWSSEKFQADKEGRKPRKLLDSDYLLGVYDETRMGVIRFSLEDGVPDCPFVSL